MEDTRHLYCDFLILYLCGVVFIWNDENTSHQERAEVIYSNIKPA
jgi:hypothetical protein